MSKVTNGSSIAAMKSVVYWSVSTTARKPMPFVPRWLYVKERLNFSTKYAMSPKKLNSVISLAMSAGLSGSAMLRKYTFSSRIFSETKLKSCLYLSSVLLFELVGVLSIKKNVPLNCVHTLSVHSSSRHLPYISVALIFGALPIRCAEYVKSYISAFGPFDGNATPKLSNSLPEYVKNSGSSASSTL